MRRLLGVEISRRHRWLEGADSQAAGWSATDFIANRHHRPARLSYHAQPDTEDRRWKYILYFLDLRGWRILELGPRTGHNTILLGKLGAREIVGVEGRPANVAICEQTRRLYRLPAVYHLADVELLAAGSQEPTWEGAFDLVVSMGLLYHLADPAPVLAWSRRWAPRLFLCTHYYERRARGHYRRPAFSLGRYMGEQVVVFREHGLDDPHGGLRPTSIWLSEDQLVRLLREAGFGRVEVLGREMMFGHPHIALLAE